MNIRWDRLLIVARQEFLNGLRSKWFLFATVGLPLTFALVIALTVFFARGPGQQPMLLVIVDETGAVEKSLAAQLDDRLSDGRRKHEIEIAKINRLAPAETILAQLRERVMKRDVDAFIHIPKDFERTAKAEYYALSVSNLEFNARVEGALSVALREKRLREAGLKETDLARLTAAATLETLRVSEAGVKKDRFQTFALVYVLVLLLYLTVAVYGVAICRSIVEEKVSRIVEVMLAAVRPFELLAGKVLGVGALGLVQTLVWFCVAMTAAALPVGPLARMRESLAEGSVMPEIPLWLVPHFLLWFVLGYFLYALLYALIASLVGSEQEAQHLQAPVTMLLIVPLLAQVAVINDPDSFFSVALSMIPFFAPIVMFMRTAVLMPPWEQIAMSALLTGITILLTLWLVVRVYRIGILSYGKRPTLRELARWIFSD